MTYNCPDEDRCRTRSSHGRDRVRKETMRRLWYKWLLRFPSRHQKLGCATVYATVYNGEDLLVQIWSCEMHEMIFYVY